MKPFSLRVLSALFFLILMSATAESTATWFHKRVVWQAGKEPRVWETKIVSPDGTEHFRLALIPLWAVEGGIVGIEILVARPEYPDDNLLGQRDNNVSQPSADIHRIAHKLVRTSGYELARRVHWRGRAFAAGDERRCAGEGESSTDSDQGVGESVAEFALQMMQVL